MEERERLAWVINRIVDEHHITNFALAKKWGISKETVQSYRNARGNAKGAVLSSLSKDYGYDGLWLITGRGEPFPGARAKFPEVCGDPEITEDNVKRVTDSVIQQQIDQGVRPPQDLWNSLSPEQKINLEEAMGKAYKLLTSGTDLSFILYAKILELTMQLDQINRLSNCIEKVNNIEKK